MSIMLLPLASTSDSVVDCDYFFVKHLCSLLSLCLAFEKVVNEIHFVNGHGFSIYEVGRKWSEVKVESCIAPSALFQVALSTFLQ